MTKAEKKLYERAITKFAGPVQMDMVIEECAELIKAILKWKRGAKNDIGRIALHQNVIEEMVDVQIMLEQLELMFGGNKLSMRRFRKEKLARLRILLKYHKS